MRINLINKKQNSENIKKGILASNFSMKDKFIIALDKFSSQMYGPFLESVVKREYNFSNVLPIENRGDAISQNNKYLEIKCGLAHSYKIKLFQIRPYQNIDYYLSFHYSPEEDDIKVFCFPHQFIVDLCSGISSSSHGSEGHRNEEKQIEINLKYRESIFTPYMISTEEVIESIR